MDAETSFALRMVHEGNNKIVEINLNKVKTFV
jgi:hypothetical protein